MKNKNGSVNILLIAVVVIIIGGGTFYYINNQESGEVNSNVDLNDDFPVEEEDGDFINNDNSESYEPENNFPIKNSNKTVNIITPNGTKQYSSSKHIVIEWWDDTDAGSKDIYIINKNGEEVVADKNMFVRSSGIDGNFRYKILDNLPDGEYKIKVCKSDVNDCDTTSQFITVNNNELESQEEIELYTYSIENKNYAYGTTTQNIVMEITRKHNNNSEIIANIPTGNLMSYLLETQEDKLILSQTYFMDSPGPCYNQWVWVYENINSNSKLQRKIVYFDLKTLELNNYDIPVEKYNENKKKEQECFDCWESGECY